MYDAYVAERGLAYMSVAEDGLYRTDHIGYVKGLLALLGQHPLRDEDVRKLIRGTSYCASRALSCEDVYYIMSRVKRTTISAAPGTPPLEIDDLLTPQPPSAPKTPPKTVEVEDETPKSPLSVLAPPEVFGAFKKALQKRSEVEEEEEKEKVKVNLEVVASPTSVARYTPTEAALLTQCFDRFVHILRLSEGQLRYCFKRLLRYRACRAANSHPPIRPTPDNANIDLLTPKHPANTSSRHLSIVSRLELGVQSRKQIRPEEIDPFTVERNRYERATQRAEERLRNASEKLAKVRAAGVATSRIFEAAAELSREALKRTTSTRDCVAFATEQAELYRKSAIESVQTNCLEGSITLREVVSKVPRVKKVIKAQTKVHKELTALLASVEEADVRAADTWKRNYPSKMARIKAHVAISSPSRAATIPQPPSASEKRRRVVGHIYNSTADSKRGVFIPKREVGKGGEEGQTEGAVSEVGSGQGGLGEMMCFYTTRGRGKEGGGGRRGGGSNAAMDYYSLLRSC